MKSQWKTLLEGLRIQRGLVFGGLIIAALVAFEVFNFSTTEFALNDLLGDMRSFGIRWATVLAIAFCGIDFAGLARLFTPEVGRDEPVEVWYLFGAWLLAAAMNAILTWWGVAVAIAGHPILGNGILDSRILLRGVPVFVAVLVWLIRVLIIGTFAMAGERLLTQEERPVPARPRRRLVAQPLPVTPRAQSVARPQASVAHPRPRPAARPQAAEPEPVYEPVYEPFYESVPLSAQPARQGNARR